ncbi:DrrA family ABC transporter ATP-binding protein [Flindersiella endophytica]
MDVLTDEAVVAEGLRRRFGETEALRGVDLAVPAGTVCGLLGPNGAGKTTAIRILATLDRPSAGSARVAGHDVVRSADQVRYRIGLAGQNAAVDEKLAGRDNLRMFGRLYHLPERVARRRADELLARFGLTEAANRLVSTYSGGMRRRLDLAASLIIAPTVLFLDEPTTGLDPRSRNEVWDAIRALVAEGTTVLLTTQYLDEADQLADQIVVLDAGLVIAAGTPADLKARIGGDRLEVVVRDLASVHAAATAIAQTAGAEPQVAAAAGRISVPVGRGSDALVAAVRALDAAGITTDDIGLRRPTLDDVFLRLTGHASEPELATSAAATAGSDGQVAA